MLAGTPELNVIYAVGLQFVDELVISLIKSSDIQTAIVMITKKMRT